MRSPDSLAHDIVDFCIHSPLDFTSKVEEVKKKLEGKK